MAEYLISELEVPEVGKTLIFKDKEARNDLSTAVVETSASNPLTFTTRSAQNAQSAEIVLEPIQDLHGYDHPWVGGAGKNKLQLGESILDNWFATDGNGITVDKTVDIKDYATCSIDELNGSIQVTNYVSTGYRWLSKVLKLEKNTSYIYSEVKTTGSRPIIVGFNSLEDNAQGTKIIDLINNTEFNTGNYEYIVISIYPPNFNSKNMMIRLATETDPTFAPYSNICPISGHTEVSLKGCGKNLISAIEANAYNNDGTTYVAGSRCRTPIFFIKNGVYTLQANTTASGKTIQTMYETWKNDSYTNNEMLSESQYASGDQTITIESDTYISMVYKYSDNSIMSYTELKSQLELGSTATTYEPYTPSNDLTKDLGQEVFGASYNPVSGELVVNMGMADLGSLTWRLSSVPNVFYAKLETFKKTSYVSMLSNKYLYIGTVLTTSELSTLQTGIFASQITYNELYFKDTSYTDAASFKTAMNGVQLVYELATPITYHLSPNEIKLLSGVNVIWTDGTSIKVAYRDGKVATLADLQEISDSPFKIVNGALCWISNK